VTRSQRRTVLASIFGGLLLVITLLSVAAVVR
jgi:hypothetical protein